MNNENGSTIDASVFENGPVFDPDDPRLKKRAPYSFHGVEMPDEGGAFQYFDTGWLIGWCIDRIRELQARVDDLESKQNGDAD